MEWLEKDMVLRVPSLLGGGVGKAGKAVSGEVRRVCGGGGGSRSSCDPTDCSLGTLSPDDDAT